jgi:mannose-6-phosphate isomerase-like protein (cupin superfamily)
MDREIRIVHRDVIPRIQEVEQGGAVHVLGELRDFRWSEALRDFMPDAEQFAISWVELGPDEVLQPHTHPIQTMLVISGGSGRMLGDLCRPLTKGDIVVVPPGCAHGFAGGPDRLSGLSIQFGQGLYADPERAHVVFSGDGSPFEITAQYNASRLEEYLRSPIFELLASGELHRTTKRRVHLDLMRGWLAGYRRALIAFQASSRSDALSLDDVALDGASIVTAPDDGDVVLEAFADWFSYRMYVLDAHEKAAVLHLVLGQATEAYFRRSVSVVGESDVSCALDRLVGSGRVEQSLKGLRTQTVGAHVRLRRILGEAWDMLRAMNDRMVTLTRAV